MSTGTKGGDIPSASTLVIDTDGDYFDITGTTGITAMTVDAGRRFTLQFDGAVTLTHGSSLYLPGATNFTTEANDCLSFIATAANTVRCTGYALKDGGSPVSAGGGAWNFIQTQVADTSSTIDFTSGIDGTYETYVVIISAATPDADTKTLQIRIGDSGGFDSGASDYATGQVYNIIGAPSGTGSASNEQINLGATHTGTGTGESLSGKVFFNRPTDGDSYPTLDIQINGYSYVPGVTQTWGGAVRTAYITVDRIQFFFFSDNILSGRFTLYGIAHA